ncbi:S-methyl-5-thioribose-1-phosphate isomerase [Actinokineospora bangkokensis]|uniref:Methylthioribose-1-phosphate isomerase n=1 Tax=Actinokineospora bangkokensis TaxID=1193682 RepID=A0A1Q9LPX4_9PSEU|nr:S-methyl-5-thioribose-1-phosphate isomerase [Actinokineospora bangkokensis]OLR94097.1 S-methyl-5-thioribose-1-phosphate isomerase [Actinokineospora bangkokensis]
MRTIDWRGDHVVIIDQTRLPHELVQAELRTVPELVEAIRSLAVRGAPALGVAGALGVALAAVTTPERIAEAAVAVRGARPTAVNLAWGVDRVLARLPEGPAAVVVEAVEVLEEDARLNRALGSRGASWLLERLPSPVNALTHCNAGALACVEWGTALGVLRSLHERQALGHVYADETRPLLQGVRITAWELAGMEVPHTVVVDSAGPSVIANGLVGAVVVGADRIAANGDVVNKVGTYPLALAAARAGIPFVVAAPESTIDMGTPDGRGVPIEVRSADEVLTWRGQRIAPAATQALNYAFDITPADLVSAIVTEARVLEPAAGRGPGDPA